MQEDNQTSPVDLGDSSLLFCRDFSSELQRRGASLRRAAAVSGWGKSTIASAGRGPGLPNVDLVVDVLGALGVSQPELDAWRTRHEQLVVRDTTSPTPPAATSALPVVRAARRPSRRTLFVTMTATAAVVVVGVLVLLNSGVISYLDTRGTAFSADRTIAVARTIVVQNKVAFGSSSLVEDDSPSYLAARPVSRCANQPDCKLPGTDLATGDPLTAVCQLQGDVLTNADVRSPGIRSNPNIAASALWYGITWPDGRRGYISEVYIGPTYRGGLELPPC